ncbi:hypothetical protein CDLVIII_2575 [Clostridium sp. DL-VIII]|uniref:flavodoxin n=1 Tax=Clostridium sp. DL-VIII TaxID=641107 RepID=UPI00023B00D2|nr:flavodoxin [Clostridium sp. DL-VIII]EHI99187.1 hypothetical protein CDLVIII_2575 [Clostridium sp. DL-VIII]
MAKSLIVYFSHSGNTEVIANIINDKVKGDLFKIDTVEVYPTSYSEVVEVAKKEKESNSRPKVTTKVENMSYYNVIYIGFPNWWSTMPMSVFTFLESYDFTDKTVIPFCTHGGGKMGNSQVDIKKLCPKSNVLRGFSISGSSVRASEKEVSIWLQKLGMIP